MATVGSVVGLPEGTRLGEALGVREGSTDGVVVVGGVLGAEEGGSEGVLDGTGVGLHKRQLATFVPKCNANASGLSLEWGPHFHGGRPLLPIRSAPSLNEGSHLGVGAIDGALVGSGVGLRKHVPCYRH